MSLHALVFSKNPETTELLTGLLSEADTRPEVCADIFSAVEKGTKQIFSCVIVDWSEQPDAGFLLKRARESQINRSAVVIAIVDDEPPPEQQRDHHLEFMIYRPIVVDEARSVLTKARQKMELHSAVFSDDVRGSAPADTHPPHSESAQERNLLATAAAVPEPHEEASVAPDRRPESDDDQNEATQWDNASQGRRIFTFRRVATALLLLTALALLWRTRATWQYLARTREGRFYVLKDSFAALLYQNRSTVPVAVQPDAYFVRGPVHDNTPHDTIGLINAEINLPDTPPPLSRAPDFPLPTPELHRDPAVARAEHPRIPDSIRNSAPIPSPAVLTVNPAQMVPVSVPPPVAPVVDLSQPVVLTEDDARARLTRSAAPDYPQEAVAQKLQGPVVVQAVITRDGIVRDVKIVRGNFLLGKAAAAAVKQWRFRPYTVDGRAVEAQAVFTLNFTYPPS